MSNKILFCDIHFKYICCATRTKLCYIIDNKRYRLVVHRHVYEECDNNMFILYFLIA